MKAWLKAPSAKKRLNKLGIFNTTTKISCRNDAPNRLVVAISLAKPNTLDIAVHKLTFEKEEIIDFFIFNYLSSKSKDTELIQYLKPVGLGPSLNT